MQQLCHILIESTSYPSYQMSIILVLLINLLCSHLSKITYTGFKPSKLTRICQYLSMNTLNGPLAHQLLKCADMNPEINADLSVFGYEYPKYD